MAGVLTLSVKRLLSVNVSGSCFRRKQRRYDEIRRTEILRDILQDKEMLLLAVDVLKNSGAVVYLLKKKNKKNDDNMRSKRIRTGWDNNSKLSHNRAENFTKRRKLCWLYTRLLSDFQRAPLF